MKPIRSQEDRPDNVEQFRERCKALAQKMPEDLEQYDQGSGTAFLCLVNRSTPLCGCVGVHVHAILQPEGTKSELGVSIYHYSHGQDLLANHLGLSEGSPR